MHLKRLVVAAVLLPLLYLYIMYLTPKYFIFLLIIMSVVALSEFYAMYRVAGIFRFSGIFFGILILCTFYLSRGFLFNIIIYFIMTLAAMRLFFKKDPRGSLYDTSIPVFGLLYIPGLLTFQAYIREIGPEWIILLYASVWAADSMAYYTGTFIGKTKLYVEVSPNKTVAGAVGSLIGGVLGVVVMKYTLIPVLTLSSVFIIGIMIGAITVVGDLVESMFKRDAGVKDSGIIIPGHGGILDKLDGALFAGPVLFWLIITIKVIR
jgi:phosphatidate cytidylyltransferase